MCGRFNLRTPLTVLSQRFLFDLGSLPTDFQIVPRNNIAPTQTVLAVRQREAGGPREPVMLSWGLIPSWAKDIKGAAKLINARAETLAEKPTFRTPLAKRRCLVLADGYYEWKTLGKEKQPLCFRMRDERPFAFAGLWERWYGPEGAKGPPLESCTIVTTSANELSAEIHDRMPVILHEADYEKWLDPRITDAKELLPMLETYPSDEMKFEPANSALLGRNCP
jgi:putative SOS response-associated peptidase YedK